MRAAATIRVLVIDNPVLDVVAHAPTSFISGFGLKPGGSCPVMSDAALKAQLFDEVCSLPNRLVTPGGGALNSLRAVSWMLPQDQPRELTAFGVVGRDKEAAEIRGALSDAGIDPQFDESAELRTGVCAVLIAEDRDRCIVADPQATCPCVVCWLCCELEADRQRGVSAQ